MAHAPFTELDVFGAFAVHVEGLLAIKLEHNTVPNSTKTGRTDLDTASIGESAHGVVREE